MIQESCRTTLFFKKSTKETYLIHVTEFPLKEDGNLVMISNIDKDWQLPVNGTKDKGNPKIKIFTMKEILDTFDVFYDGKKIY